MYKRSGEMVNERIARIMRFAGLVMPILLLFYGVLIDYGLVDASHYSGTPTFLAIIVPWVLVGCYQFLFPSVSWQSSGLRFGLYHVFSIAYILLVSGFAMAFIATWVLLFLSAYAYFFSEGVRLSVAALVGTAIIDSLLHINDTPIIVTATLTTLAILIVGIAVIAISRIQEIDGAELSRSKALESFQRDRILAIVNNLADAVMSTDEKGVVKVHNAASLNLLDTNTNLNGQRVGDILQLRDSNGQIVDLQKLLRESHGVTVRDDLSMALEDETIRLEVTCSPIRGSYSKKKHTNTEEGYIIILRDVTKTKSLEEERDEFISVVSHELRTPITIAEGTISNVQVMMNRPDISTTILKKGIVTAHEQVIFLSRMVNDLSTLSRAERGVADEPEIIDVHSLVSDLFGEYAPQAKAKNLRFDLDLGTHLGNVSASRLYLKELLQNFITNSIKYTREGNVTLSVHRKNAKIIFEVRDTGIGISKGDQTKIFNKFYRSEDYRTRETGGTGLGLYVAMKLAKKLGTDIELKSRLNHGSSFSFTLPIKTK